MTDLILDALAALTLGTVLVLGFMGCNEPTFADRCVYCGEYLPDIPAAHEHLANCPPCDGSQGDGPCR